MLAVAIKKIMSEIGDSEICDPRRVFTHEAVEKETRKNIQTWHKI